MTFALRRPRWPLAKWVEVLWLHDGFVQPHARERLLPDGSMELVIHLTEDRIRMWDRRDPTNGYQALEGAMVIGTQTEYFVIDTDRPQCVMGAHFRPGGAFPFLGLPAGEVEAQFVSLSDLWGNCARDLRERMLEAETSERRFDILEAALTARLAASEFHPSVDFALRAFSGPTRRKVSDVTREAGLSPRRFIEVFRSQVGIAPKMYCRLRRFQSVVTGLPLGGAVDWATAAADAGYSDQSHLVHDFRAIAGLSPTAWEGLRTGHRNHVPMP